MSKPQTHKYAPQKEMFTIEWQERGHWVRSAGEYSSMDKAEEHAQIIGAVKYRIVPVTYKKGSK